MSFFCYKVGNADGTDPFPIVVWLISFREVGRVEARALPQRGRRDGERLVIVADPECTDWTPDLLVFPGAVGRKEQLTRRLDIPSATDEWLCQAISSKQETADAILQR